MPHLVLLETSGNQRFIFATNKLRENVGASEATFRVGERLVRLAAAGVPGLREVMVTSGKALLLVDREEQGRQIVRGATRRALDETPGLDLTGVVSRGFDLDTEPLHRLVGEVHEQFEATRASRPGPELRFQRLPLVDECATSGLPASAARGDGSAVSQVSLRKAELSTAWHERLRGILPAGVSLPGRVDELEQRFEDLSWLGVVHADGNGLGQIFLNFDDYLFDRQREQRAESQRDQNERYIRLLGAFSRNLDRCCEGAFLSALGELDGQPGRARHPTEEKACVPLVLGGDDLTAICDGERALGFARAFLLNFSELTTKDEIIGEITERAYGQRGLGACAGVAIVKPHFPFSLAYELAEGLCASAKGVKTALGARHSALDFHVLRDTSYRDLEAIRGELRLRGGERLYCRPLVVSDGPTDDPWFRRRSWASFLERVHTIQGAGSSLPSSQLHELRSALLLGRAEADARLRLIYQRYPWRLRSLVESAPDEPPSLFFEEDGGVVSRFLDTIETTHFV